MVLQYLQLMAGAIHGSSTLLHFGFEVQERDLRLQLCCFLYLQKAENSSPSCLAVARGDGTSLLTCVIEQHGF